MRTTLLAFGLIAATFHSHAVEAPYDWKRFLDTPLVDEWQPIFGAALTYPARPAKTWAQKFVEFQLVVSKSTGGHQVPIYLSPALAATPLPAMPAQDRVGVPLVHVPLVEAVRYIAGATNIQMRVTDSGILLELPAKPQSK